MRGLNPRLHDELPQAYVRAARHHELPYQAWQ
jgi:hypothetical protein